MFLICFIYKDKMHIYLFFKLFSKETDPVGDLAARCLLKRDYVIGDRALWARFRCAIYHQVRLDRRLRCAPRSYLDWGAGHIMHFRLQPIIHYCGDHRRIFIEFYIIPLNNMQCKYSCQLSLSSSFDINNQLSALYNFTLSTKICNLPTECNISKTKCDYCNNYIDFSNN